MDVDFHFLKKSVYSSKIMENNGMVQLSIYTKEKLGHVFECEYKTSLLQKIICTSNTPALMLFCEKMNTRRLIKVNSETSSEFLKVKHQTALYGSTLFR